MISPDVQQVLSQLGAPSEADWRVEDARAEHERNAAWFTPASERANVASVEELRVAGVRARVYRPHGVNSSMPTLLWLHGGGWMTGSLDTGDIIAREVTAGAGIVVVAPEYRLAPEHRWPAALEDAAAVLEWLFDHVDELGGDPAAILVGGDSAGGNLASVLAHTDMIPRRLAGQALIYPVMDLNLDATAYPSRLEFAAGFHLEWVDVVRCVSTYLDGTNPDQVTVSPLRAGGFEHLSPTVVATADLDPLRDEGRMYAERVRNAGVPVVYLNTRGLVHGGFDMVGVSATARTALDGFVRAIRELFGATR